MKIKIHITKDILKKSMWCGTTNETSCVLENCAIALAVRDIFPNAQVSSLYLVFNKLDKENRAKVELLPFTRAYIKLFDNTIPGNRIHLPEYSFEIEVPEEIIDSIGIDEAKRILEKSETLELIET